MQFVKQSTEIPIKNIDEYSFENKPKEKRHSALLPNNLRCIIAGSSGTGKTNLLISLIESEHGIKFENIYLYSKTLDQDKYKYLEKILSPIKGIGYHTFASTEDIITPNEAKRNSVFIFDDVICDKNQTPIRNLFCLGRHFETDVIYLTQSLVKLNKNLLRENCNFAILFRMDILNMRHAFHDFNVDLDMSFEDFKQFCGECWKEKYGFVIIDLDSESNNGRYRRNFSDFLQLNKNDDNV